MAVHLTRIYTKTGDDGTTALGDMSRVRKTDPRLTAYADVDEANSAIGVALALGDLTEDVRAVLGRVQNDLFDVGADLCTPVVPDPEYPPLRVLPTTRSADRSSRSSVDAPATGSPTSACSPAPSGRGTPSVSDGTTRRR